MKKIYDALKSRRVAVVLIIVVLFFLIVGMIIPQASFMERAELSSWQRTSPTVYQILTSLGLTSLFTQNYFYLLLILLAINLFFCTLDRVIRRQRAGRRVRTEFRTNRFKSDQVWVGNVSQKKAKAIVQGVLTSLGYKVKTSGQWIMGEKYRSGFWGSILFHFAMVVIVIGGVIAGLTSFEGTMLLTEGQALPDQRSSYLEVTKKPVLGAAFTGSRLLLNDMRVFYTRGVMTDTEADVTIFKNGLRQKDYTIKVNYPLRYEGKSFVIKEVGYTPQITIGRGNKNIFSSLINLAERTRYGYQDKVFIPSEQLKVEVEMFPNFPKQKSDPRTRYRLIKPCVEVRLTGVSGKQYAGGVLLGRGGQIGPYKVGFEDARLWGLFFVRSDKGIFIVYLGFWLSLFGLIWRFLVIDKVVRVRISKEKQRATLGAKWRAALSSIFVSADKKRFEEQLEQAGFIRSHGRG